MVKEGGHKLAKKELSLCYGVDFIKCEFCKAPVGTGPFKFKEPAMAGTEEEQKKALLNAETILNEELPELPLFDVSRMYVWNKRVQNAFVPARNFLQSEPLEDVYVK